MKPFVPSSRYIVLAPKLRLAEDVLRYDHHIEPRMPILQVTHNLDSLRGLRTTPALVIDPGGVFRTGELQLIDQLRRYNRIRDWTDEDFTYLRNLTQGGSPAVQEKEEFGSAPTP